MRLHTPYCYRYINRGISGNRIVDLYDRMGIGFRKECIPLLQDMK